MIKALTEGIKTIDGYTLKAKNIVVATNAPIVDETSKIYDKQDAYRTYVIGATYVLSNWSYNEYALFILSSRCLLEYYYLILSKIILFGFVWE